MFKSLGTAAVLAISYVNHTFSPFFWVLLALAGLDILLNMHREGQQFQKIGSAVASIGGISVLEGHLGNPDILRVSVAVLVLAYLQVVVPQLIAMVKNFHFASSQKVNAAEKDLASKVIQSQASQIAAMVRQQLLAEGVVPASASEASAPSSTTGGTGVQAGYHV